MCAGLERMCNYKVCLSVRYYLTLVAGNAGSKSPDRIPLIRYIHIEFLAQATGNEYEVIRHRVLTTVSHSLESFALWSTVATTLG